MGPQRPKYIANEIAEDHPLYWTRRVVERKPGKINVLIADTSRKRDLFRKSVETQLAARCRARLAGQEA